MRAAHLTEFHTWRDCAIGTELGISPDVSGVIRAIGAPSQFPAGSEIANVRNVPIRDATCAIELRSHVCVSSI